MKKILLSVSLLLLTFGASFGQNLFTENFDTFATLATNGWQQTNQSEPAGLSTWAQGGGTAFAGGGFNGSATSFALVNFNSGSGVSDLSNWLITPTISVQNGDVVTFYSRKGGTSGAFPDGLQFRMSPNGDLTTNPSTGSTDLGDFTNLLVDINPALTTTGYPLAWTQYSYTVAGLTEETPVKFAFRYFVVNGGPDGDNSNIIGIDAFAVNRPLANNQDFFTNNFSVQPNPVNDIFTLTTKSGVSLEKVQVIDMNGRVVSETNVSSTDAIQVNVSDLTAGVYFVKAQSNLGVGTSKIIKK